MTSQMAYPATVVAASGYDFVVAVQRPDGTYHAETAPVIAWVVVDTYTDDGGEREIVPFGVLDEDAGRLEDVRTLANFIGVARKPADMDRWHRKAREWATRRRQRAS